MPSDLQNLDTLFNSSMFRVPDYQRGYSWGDSQLVDFWDDLARLDVNRNHYTGPLTLQKASDSEWPSWDTDTWLIDGRGYRPYYIVDGQQRLTTAIILIKCLLDLVPDNTPLAFSDTSDHVKKYLFQKSGISTAFVFGYQIDNPSYDYFKTQILAVPQLSYKGIETTYTMNLLYARDFFRNKLAAVGIREIDRLFKALTQRFVFNVYELVDDLDVFVVFETMNNRGKKLSALELLKNRLIYLSTLLPSPAVKSERLTLRKNINDAWKTVFEFLGREKGAALDDDEFLWAHWAMYFDYDRREADALERSLLQTHFTPKSVGERAVATSLQDYVASVQASVRKWHEIHFPHRATALSDDVRRELERLDRLGRGAFEPLMMAALQICEDESELKRLLASAEQFVFVANRLCRTRADAGDTEFYRLAHELFKRAKTPAQAIQAIDDRTTKHFSGEKAIAEMRELFRIADGFYSWSALPYFLFEYEQYLKDRSGKQEGKMDWSEFTATKRDHVTIEHIYPQAPKQDEWPDFSKLEVAKRRALSNSRGNLLALSQSRNKSFSNKAFGNKKRDAKGVKGYYNGSYSEIAVAQVPGWSPETILRRGLEMVEFLETRWNIFLGSQTEKKRFLGFADP